jgi:hypothetical protein
MKAKKAFTVIGKKLEKEYKKYGFRYSKKYQFLKKTTKKLNYHIFFSSFFGTITDTYTELHVVLVVNDKMVLKTNINAKSEIFRVDLWETGNHYNIANETLINNVFTDLKKKIDEHLIPQVKKLEI